MLKDESYLLIGPGRWGTTTPSLGVPVRFAEISNAKVICEVAYPDEDLMPELSFGSHFFQDLVESDIFYAAVFQNYKENLFNPGYLQKKNYEKMDTEAKTNVVSVYRSKGLEIFSDVVEQKVLCR
ncbi:MAG TPA: hypothetical protein DHN33_08180 [Eubacteriaceae bacterium]|nr:hypothetical protein [Eubacteriaceae bacterium]